MKIVKIVGLVVLVLVAIVVVVGLVLPRGWEVERRITVAAAPEAIHPWVVDLRQWEKWAAWNNEMDPDAKWEFGGGPGVGAWMSWNGPKMGRGKITVTREDPQAGVWIDEQIESDEVNAHGAVTYEPKDGMTEIVWRDNGTLPPVIGGFFRPVMEKMLGGHFETGLQGLKELAEADAPEAVEPAEEAAEATEGA